MRGKKPTCISPLDSEVSPMFPLKQVQFLFDLFWRESACCYFLEWETWFLNPFCLLTILISIWFQFLTDRMSHQDAEFGIDTLSVYLSTLPVWGNDAPRPGSRVRYWYLMGIYTYCTGMSQGYAPSRPSVHRCVTHGFMEWLVGFLDITDTVFDLYNFRSCSSHSFQDRWALPALSCCCLHVQSVRSALVC